MAMWVHNKLEAPLRGTGHSIKAPAPYKATRKNFASGEQRPLYLALREKVQHEKNAY
jgi:hypothetical protein